MSSEHGIPPSAAPDDTATRFDRAGESAYNLALRVTGSPGAAWHATVATFSAVAERIPSGAPDGVAEQDLLLMGCWHARSLLTQVASSPEYAAQLRQHDEAALAAAPLRAPVVAANGALPVDQREVLALRGLSDLGHAELSALLRVDAGLLATMLAQSRFMLQDALKGGDLGTTATADPEDRHALALAALRQDGQLRGPEGRERLAAWLQASDRNGELVAALEEAGLAYRAWSPDPVPAGLRDAVVAAAATVQLPPPIVAAPPAEPAPAEPAPAAATDPEPADVPGPRTPEPPAATPTPPVAAADDDDPVEVTLKSSTPGPVAPRGAGAAPPADPGATVEWSSTDVAALGLEGANVRREPARQTGSVQAVDPDESGSEEEWDDAWDNGEQSGDLFQAVDRAGRAPRWQIVLVGILLVAVIVALIVALTGGDDPTPESTTQDDSPTPTTSTSKRSTTRTTKDTSAVPSGRVVAQFSTPGATVRIVRG
ncbi:RNA polymerase sigma factor [Patulibacter minatonensis]|uniref:RNA polymerase sigma factor n=1 Tax=Patulibacter minatonensis TaxID=298163 RepID=UPI00047A62CF|nr:sigma-70 region 4 domain-containing protein [Patulibacter minatonensis]